jgi:HD-like signal output (HDOD) protein
MASAGASARASPCRLKLGRRKVDFGRDEADETSMLDHELIAKAAAGLEPLPPTVNRLASAIAREDGGLGEIEEIVSLDPVLTGRVLNAANSAAETRGPKIAAVRGALLKMGSGRVLALALGGALVRRLRRQMPGYGLSEGALWRHAVASSAAVELLYGVSRIRIPSEAFASALLHDLGQIVLAQFLDPDLRRRLAEAHADGLSTRAAEVEILGLHNGEVGALVVSEWRLPEQIGRAIAFAGTASGGDDPLFDVVHLSHVVAGRIGEYPGMPADDLTLDQQVLDRVGVTRSGLDAVLVQLQGRLGGVLRLYGA